MKLVFINTLPVSRIIGDKIDAWWFEKNGFDVEFIDCSPLFWSKEKLDKYFGGSSDYRYIGPKHTIINTIDELNLKFDVLDKDTLIFYLSRGLYRPVNDDWLLTKIAEKKFELILFSKQLPYDMSLSDKILRPLRNLKYYFINKKLKPLAFIGCGGIMRKLSKRVYPKADFISIPSVSIIWKPTDRIIQEDYNVFIDENVIYAPDAKMLGLQICTDVKGYYKRMSMLFTKIEKWTGNPVVICASGKYQYKEDLFENRKIIYKNTLELIAHANIVVGHISSAIEQVVVSKKPFLMVDDVSFTDVKRKGFGFTKKITGKKPLLNNKITKSIFYKNIAIDEKYNSSVIKDYFKEDGVNGHYKNITLNYFKKYHMKGKVNINED